MKLRLWIARILIGIVFFWNVQCAILFLAEPDVFAPSFELSGVSGRVMIQALGLLFLMWNVPYGFALFDPIRHNASLFQAMVMQLIGLGGETAFYFMIPAGHFILQSSGLRFIIFDGLGLIGLALAMGLAQGLVRPRG